MKILLLNPNQIHRYNWGHQLYKNEVGKQHRVVYYGKGWPHFNPKLNVKQIVHNFCPDADLIMTYCWKYSKNFKGLDQITNIPKVHFALDYTENNFYQEQNTAYKQTKYDIIFAFSQRACKLLKKNNASENIVYHPFSVDTNIYREYQNIAKRNNILAAYTTKPTLYPNRIKIIKMLKKNFIVISNRVVQKKLVEWINRAKITITSNNIYNSLSMRYTETLACGGFLLADRPDDLDLIGLEDGKHLVLYKDLKDLRGKCKYYMKNDKVRNRIRIAGMNHVRKNHSCKVRVKQMTNAINERLGIK